MERRPKADKPVFSFAEAAALLPEVRRLTERAHAQIEALGGAITVGGDLGAETRERAQAVVEEWAQTLVAKGLEVKGLWLVDFDNGSGYYCWRYPEPSLQYYHSYEDGFQGRMRIQ
jgi:hypothetical protein